VDAAAHVIAMGSPIAQVAQSKPGAAPALRKLDAARLAVGAKVHVPKWNLTAEVTEITAKGDVKVAAGALRAIFSIDELLLTQGARPAPPSLSAPQRHKKSQPDHNAPAATRNAPVRVDSNTLDLRGQRVDEALDHVDAFVDAMLLRGETAAYVLHGHGTGALKQAVRSHLRDSLVVSDSSPADPEDGGDAFTIFWLPTG
jgi:DNA mismatch repair protein MutS2